MQMHIFHGTTEKNYSQMKKTNKITFIKRPDHWLGGGIYFFINDYLSAFRWSTRVKKDLTGCVLEYTLEIESKDYLDLDSETDLERFDSFVEGLNVAGYRFEFDQDDIKYIKKYPDRESIVLRSKYLELFYRLNKIKVCSYTFEGPFDEELKAVKKLGFNSKSRQLVVVDPMFLDISKLKRVSE